MSLSKYFPAFHQERIAPPYPIVQNVARILPMAAGFREQSKKFTTKPNEKEETHPAKIVKS